MKKKIIIISIVVIIILSICSIMFFNKENNEEIEYINKFNNVIDDNIINLSNDYPLFINNLINANIKMPIIDNMIPQGLAVTSDNYIVTYYDELQEKSSLVDLLDFEGKIINEKKLNNKSHVGGVAYDSKRELVWIPGENGILNVYNYNDFFNNVELIPQYIFTNLSDDLINYKNNNEKEISFLTINEDKLFIGNFSLKNSGKIKEYQINDNNSNIKLTFIKEYSSLNYIQGMTFYNINDKQYLILSHSYGRNNNSKICIYEFDENKNSISEMTNIKKVILPPLLEQISIKDNYLYLIFESGSKKYQNNLIIISEICVININRLIFDDYSYVL